MKKFYASICTILVTLVVGLVVHIHGLLKGIRYAVAAPDKAKDCVNAMDDAKANFDKAFHGDRDGKEELKGYSSIKVVDDSEESDN